MSANQDILSTLWIDVEEAIEDLGLLHLKSSDFNYNPSAYTGVKQANDHMMCCCPIHAETSPSFGIHMLPPYKCQCFSCGYTGNIAMLYAHELDKGLNYMAGLKYILRNFATTTEERPQFDLDAHLTRDVTGKRVQDDSVLESFKMTEDSLGYKYLRNNRKFTQRAIDTYELGYDTESNSITIPVRDAYGKLRFIKRRNIKEKSFLNEEAVYKKDILYGLHLIRKNKIKRVKIVESETDAVACYCGGFPAVATMGIILFDEQVNLLLKSNIEVVDLFLDDDEKGREGTQEMYEKLKRHVRVNCVRYPELLATKMDANELLKLGFLRHVEFDPMILL